MSAILPPAASVDGVFGINGVAFGHCVSGLKVNKTTHYNAQVNAAGNTVVDFVNHKRTIEVNVIPLDDATMRALQNAISNFNVTIDFRNPETGAVESINCIIPENNTEYYTIQGDRVLYKAFTLSFIEL